MQFDSADQTIKSYKKTKSITHAVAPRNPVIRSRAMRLVRQTETDYGGNDFVHM